MPIILSPALIVSPVDALPASHPVVGWHSVVQRDNVTADSETATGPATNLGNSSTANRWQSASTAEQLVTVSEIEGATDYLGIARHNLAGMAISVEAITAEPGADWEEVHPGLVVADLSPIVLRFSAGFYIGVRLRIAPADVAPRIAVLHVGLSLVLQRSMQAGFTPIADGQENDLVTGWSESGEHLGSIIDGARSSNSAEFRAFEPDWYRDHMRPWVQAGNAGEPFFFAWDPLNRPTEVGFCVFGGNVRPVINYVAGKQLDVTIPMNAVAL